MAHREAPTRRSVLAGAAGLGAAALARPGFAQARFPDRPIRIVIPFAPGGATDIVARLLAAEMQRDLGQPLTVESRTGAGGIIAIEHMARSRPDGYTLMIGNVSTNAITPIVFRARMPLDYLRYVVPVGRLAELPAMLVTTLRDFPPTSMAALLEYGRRHPGRLNYASAGVGSFPHFDAAIFARRAGLQMVHVPMPAGAGQIIPSLLSGDVHLAFLNVASVAPHVRDGRIRAIAAVSEARLPDFPDLPTMAEAGFPGVGTVQWQGLFAPAETPREVLETLHRAAGAALRAETLQDAFRRQGIRAVPNESLDAAREWLRSEMALWERLTTEAAIDLN